MQTIRSFATGAIGALALTIVATTAQAVPMLGVTGAVRMHADDGGRIAKVTWGWRRGCYWHHGFRYCSSGHRYWRHSHRPGDWYAWRWQRGRHSQY